MKKNYFIFLFFVLAFAFTQQGFSQNYADTNSIQQKIEDLSIYPNPVTNNKVFVYITSKRNLTKTIEFYNVLGKQILTTTLNGKELNISNLSKGVYVVKITEANITETRKLVIK